MGIEGLLQTFINDNKQKKTKGINYKIPLSDLSGKRVWADVNAVFYAYWNAIAREVCDEGDIMEETVLDYKTILLRWQSSSLRTAQSWVSAGIKLTLVMDGQAPIDKADKQGERRSDRDVYMQAATEAVKEVCQLCNVEYREKMLHTGPLTIPIQHAHRVRELKEIHKKNMKCCVDPIRENWNELAETLVGEGFIVVRSNVEAETLCCKAVLTGEADYVLSSDSDCLAYGVPVWLRDYDSTDRSFRAVALEEACERTGVPRERFTDFCILCGCDYNKRVMTKKDGSALRMGPVTAAEKLHAMSLEELMRDERVDWSVLRVAECRKIFGLEIKVESTSLRMSSDLVFA